MGKLALAAKISHVPSMYLSELPGEHHGCRDDAIAGHRAIGQRARDLGVDTMLVLDTHWLVNSGFHINCNHRFEGCFTSHELPHFIRDMPYGPYYGNPPLGRLIEEHAVKAGINARANELDSLKLEYGTLVPCRYMNQDGHFKVVSIASWLPFHTHADGRTFGHAIRAAIDASDSTVMLLASGSLSHRFHDNRDAEAGRFTISREFFRQVDVRVLQLWRAGDWKTFCAMLPEYAQHCYGEGNMQDTVMLLAALGWDAYTKPAEIVTDYFTSSGTGQINAIFNPS